MAAAAALRSGKPKIETRLALESTHTTTIGRRQIKVEPRAGALVGSRRQGEAGSWTLNGGDGFDDGGDGFGGGEPASEQS